MHLEFDYLSGQNIPMRSTDKGHDDALKQTLLDLDRSTLTVDGEDLGICYLPRGQNTPCLFRAALSFHPTQAYFLINTIEHAPDATLQSSWRLYLNVHSNQPGAPSFIELPLSWMPDVEQALKDKTLTTLSSEDKLHIQTLLNLQKKEQLSLNLFNRGFYALFENNEFSSEEKMLFLNFLQENTNQSSFYFLDAAYFFEKKRQMGFHFLHSDNTSYKQIYRAISKCSLILSSIEPSSENLDLFSIDFDCAYVFYENKLYFIDKKFNQCTLLIEGNTALGEEVLNSLDQALSYRSLTPNRSRKLLLKELKNIKLITSHSFDYTPVIELVFHAHYDHCASDFTFIAFTESMQTIQEVEKEIVRDKMPDFFIAQTCLNDIIDHLADSSSEAKIRLDSGCAAEDRPDLESTYISLMESENQFRMLAQQLDVLILLVKNSLFFHEKVNAQPELLCSYQEKTTELFKFKLSLLPQNIKETGDLTDFLFSTISPDSYNTHLYRKALLQASSTCIDEFNALLDTFLSEKLLEDDLLYEMKRTLEGKITPAHLRTSLFNPDFNSRSQTDEQKIQFINFIKIKNKLLTLLEKRNQFRDTFILLMEKVELIKEITSKKTHLFALMQKFFRHINHTELQLKISHQINYLFETTAHLTPDQDRIKPTLVSKKMRIFSKEFCAKKGYLEAFQEELSIELRNKLLEASSFSDAVNNCSYYELFKLITFSDLAFFTEEQQHYLLNRFITTSSFKRKSLTELKIYDASHNHIEHDHSVFRLTNCIALTTELLKELLLANKDTLTEIYIENCPKINNESIALFSNKQLRLKKIVLDNLPNVRNIEIKEINTLVNLTIKNCSSLEYLKIRSSCTALRQDQLDLENLPALQCVFFKVSQLPRIARSFTNAIHKKLYNDADKFFKLITSLKELNSVSFIYALGTWGLSENAENPERILNAMRLLLCATTPYKKFTYPLLAKLENKLSDFPESDEIYPKMMTRITNVGGTLYPPNAFLELLKHAGRSRSCATLFDFRDVNINNYYHQIEEMIAYLKSFLTEDISPDILLEKTLSRCDTDIPNDIFFLNNPTELDPTQPTPFHLLVTPDQKDMIKTMCIKYLKAIDAPEPGSSSELGSSSEPEASRESSQDDDDDDDKKKSLGQSGSSDDLSDPPTPSAPLNTAFFTPITTIPSDASQGCSSPRR